MTRRSEEIMYQPFIWSKEFAIEKSWSTAKVLWGLSNLPFSLSVLQLRLEFTSDQVLMSSRELSQVRRQAREVTFSWRPVCEEFYGSRSRDASYFQNICVRNTLAINFQLTVRLVENTTLSTPRTECRFESSDSDVD